MSCEVEQIGDCGDLASLGRALFIPDKEDHNWLSQCSVSLSPCGNLLAVGYKTRLCFLTSQWINATECNTYIISWSGTLTSELTCLLALPICPSQQSSQNGPDWFCIMVGYRNGTVAFYTNTGHLLLAEKLDESPLLKISCHTGTYGTLPDDIHFSFHSGECIVSGTSLFQTLRNAKSQMAKVQAGMQTEYTIDSRNISIKKWTFSDQETINDAAVVGLELKNTYDHLLAASTYGGYDTWYRSVPPVSTLILGAGAKPYIGFHYALEGGITPPLQDVARAVANKIKSALPGWLGGGNTEATLNNTEPQIRSESLSLRFGLIDAQRQGTTVAVSPDRRLAAVSDNLGRVAVLDVKRGHLIRLFKGYREAQCAFIQIFDFDKKVPHMSVVKEIKRAVFLIIYNPKKGLIDIRLMQTGNRVAVFTATKNGQLIYNTCGLVGAEKNYTHKKLNLPEFQCVLIDPDGKLKKFNIPFFYALEGEDSERSKDLHTLRDLRDYIKKTSQFDDDFEVEIIKKISVIKTLDLMKTCLEMLVRNYEITSKILTSCILVFWNNIKVNHEEPQLLEIKSYLANMGLLVLFYRNINNDDSENMQELFNNINEFKNIEAFEVVDTAASENDFHLLEDDSCILERLLLLANETQFREHHHAKVTFADCRQGGFKEFMACFTLEADSRFITLKYDLPLEKLNSLASNTFEAIYKIKNLNELSKFVKLSNIDPKDIVKVLIVNLIEMPLAQITIELIEKTIQVLYYLCSVTEDAFTIKYNKISPWWQQIRDTLVEMQCPLRSMIVAMACKAVSRIFESNSYEDEEAWESVTKENAKWGILIGKLEDISILSIVLMYKDEFSGDSFPKLHFDEININLKFVYTRGTGSVTELIAKWLCSMGVPPKAILINALLETEIAEHLDSESECDNDDDYEYVFLLNHRHLVDNNPKIFKWFSLLRRQFPLSTITDYIIANMAWEYAISWQKNMQNVNELEAVVLCLKEVSNAYLRMGLFTVIWSTYLRHTFEIVCRLVNKVGRLPKDSFCLQDLKFNNENMIKFLETVTSYLSDFYKHSSLSIEGEKQIIRYEKIWEESIPSLVEVAQDVKPVSCDIINLNYQFSCTIYYMCHFNIKFSKPLDSLYDIDYQYILEALAGNVPHREISLKASEKIRNPRFKFITKLIRASIETITVVDNGNSTDSYDNRECTVWMEKILVLAELWNIPQDFLRRQQVIGLYHMGYDTLAEVVMRSIQEPELIYQSILALTIQRLKRSLEHSPNQSEWIVSLSPQLYQRLKSVALDTSVPAHPSLATTTSVLQRLIFQIDNKVPSSQSSEQSMKLLELIVENCEMLLRRKL